MSVAASKQGLEFLFCEETESRQTPQYHHGSQEFGISRCTSGFSLAIHTAAQQNAVMSPRVQNILVLTGSDSPRIQAGWHDLRRRLQDVPDLEVVGVFSASDSIDRKSVV